MPSSHNYAKSKSAAAEIQIVYELKASPKEFPENKNRFVTISQMFLKSKFENKI